MILGYIMNSTTSYDLSGVEKEVLYYINILIDYDIEEDISINIESIINNATYLTSLNLQDTDSIIKNLIKIRMIRIVPYVRDIVSDDLKEKLKHYIFIKYQEKLYIKKFGKDERKIFYIDIEIEEIRFDMFWKYMVDKIKQIKQNLIYHNQYNESGIFEYVAFIFNYLVDSAIRYTICIERNPKEKYYNLDDCQKMFANKEDSDRIIEYKLDNKSHQILIERLILFIENHDKQKKDIKADKTDNKKLKQENFEYFKSTLKNTIKYAKVDIDRIFTNYIYLGNSACKRVYENHMNMIKNIKTIINTPAKIRAFREELHKSNMHYISKYNNEDIFPILLDLIVNRYVYILEYSIFENEFIVRDARVKLYNETEEKYLNPTSSENYNFMQLKGLIDNYPQKYHSDKLKQNIEQNISIILIKHYSQIFNAPYNSIANVLKQLFLNGDESRRREYDLYKEVQNDSLNIDYDYFRYYSLYII